MAIDTDLQKHIISAARAASDKGAQHILALDLTATTSSVISQCFLICTGSSMRQVRAIVGSIEKVLDASGCYPEHIEGYSGLQWVLMDYGSFVVHVFIKEKYMYYQLERLWSDAFVIPWDRTHQL